MEMIAIQAIGGIGYLSLAFSYFRKEKKQILIMQILAYIFFSTHFYLLNGISGVICNLTGLAALVTIYFFDKYKLKHKEIAVAFFVAILLIVNIITFQNIFSLFPMVAATIVIVSFLFDENKIRIVGVISAICWLVYAIAYNSYISIVFEVITLLNVGLALIKNWNGKKKIGNKEDK